MTLATLRKKAIKVVPGMEIVQELGSIEPVEAEFLQGVIASSEKSYGTNNGSVAWVEDGNYYVMPFTLGILETLKENGFKDKSISVMISSWKSPANPELKARWETLQAEQRKA